MKRRSLRGKALLNSLAQSLVSFWGYDYVHSVAYRNGSQEFRNACFVAYLCS